MKIIVFFLSFLVAINSMATTYYVSVADGNGANNGTSTGTPWTYAKLNSSAGSLVSGDQVLFKRGELFYGSLTVSKSGIAYGAYGSGANPQITGFQDVTAWTSLGGNKWQSTSAVSSLSTLNMVTIGGVFQEVSKFPNTGYQTITTSSATTITNAGITGSYVGGYAVVRKQHWIIDRSVISSQSGTTITFANPNSGYSPQNGWGFRITNCSASADVQNEWWYDPSTKKIGIYSTTTPTGVKVATVDVLVNGGNFSNSFTNIDFTGSNTTGYNGTGGNGLSFTGCDFSFHGTNAIILSGGMSGVSLLNCSAHWIMNNFCNGNSAPNMTITNGDFNNIGMVPGMGLSGDGQYIGFSNIGAFCLAQYNHIKDVGYIGIEFKGAGCQILNNVFDHTNAMKDDGGAIYTFTGATAVSYSPIRKVIGNIIINGGGAHPGTNTTNDDAHGIYMDDNASDVLIQGNTIGNNGSTGIFLHAAHNITVRDNKVYNAVTTGNYGQFLILFPGAVGADLPITGLLVRNNQFVSKNANQFVATFNNSGADMTAWGLFDSNTYARPISEGATLSIKSSNKTLAQWRTLVNGEAHSTTSPRTVTSTDQIFFQYNATNSPVTVPIGGTYIDVGGVFTYSGNVTIPAWGSKILLYVSGTVVNQPPVAIIAGGTKTITLPTNSVSLDGSGSSDPENGPLTYTWAKVSGAGGSITTGAATATASGLTAGQYVFSLTVKDNQNATSTTNVTVNVNAATNQPPVANAGAPQGITLPTNSTTLNGTASTDPEGGTLTYSWSKLAGSPGGGAISNSAIASPGISGLLQGIYTYQLVVTDNGGLQSTSTVRITVNAAANTNPIALAGTNQIITLPANTAILDGTASNDPGGSITAYAWSKISGPATFTITNASAASTTATGLVAGTYLFKLVVTDNSAATGADTLTVVVNAKPMVNPVANAGPNITITLPKDSTTLDGTGSSDDESISTYAWAKYTGPTGGTVVSASLASTRITGLQVGVYQYILTVTDNDGNSSKDTVSVTVVERVNKLPVANAGLDQILIWPVNSTTLTGFADIDETLTYTASWREAGYANGPIDSATINSPSTDATAIHGLSVGDHTFEYKVTDSAGKISYDYVTIFISDAESQPGPKPKSSRVVGTAKNQ